MNRAARFLLRIALGVLTLGGLVLCLMLDAWFGAAFFVLVLWQIHKAV